jgi:hypothetical protein
VTTEDLFRPEALRAFEEPDLGSVLRLSRWWLPVSFWLLLAAGLTTGVVAARGSLPVYESGVGVLHSSAGDSRESVAGCSIDGLNPAGSNAGMMYVAVLTGNSRQKLAPGMRVLLRLSGYSDAVVVGTLDAVGDRLLAAEDVRSTLRSLGADSNEINGPVVAICGRLETDRFTSGGVEYRVQAGMLASARVKVREERILDHLFPHAR